MNTGLNIPRDKSHPPTAAQCHGCGGHGCERCDNKGWVPADSPDARRCHRDACETVIPPAQVAVYCTNQCAYDDA